VTNIHAVTNPNSAFERITDMSKGSKDAAQIQQFLETARAELAVTKTVHGRGKVGIAIDTNLKVIQVQTGSPAELSGVRVGDRILAIDGVRALNNREATLKITGEPGTAVELQIDRGGSQQLVKIVRGEP
jgi:carboxyl-terminal processing protease